MILMINNRSLHAVPICQIVTLDIHKTAESMLGKSLTALNKTMVKYKTTTLSKEHRIYLYVTIFQVHVELENVLALFQMQQDPGLDMRIKKKLIIITKSFF